MKIRLQTFLVSVYLVSPLLAIEQQAPIPHVAPGKKLIRDTQVTVLGIRQFRPESDLQSLPDYVVKYLARVINPKASMPIPASPEHLSAHHIMFKMGRLEASFVKVLDVSDWDSIRAGMLRTVSTFRLPNITKLKLSGCSQIETQQIIDEIATSFPHLQEVCFSSCCASHVDRLMTAFSTPQGIKLTIKNADISEEPCIYSQMENIAYSVLEEEEDGDME